MTAVSYPRRRVNSVTTYALVAFSGITSQASVLIPPNVRVTGQLSGIQNEEQVFFCPTDSNIIVTNHRDLRLGYRQVGIARSIDGGATWSDALIPLPKQKFPLQSDPGMTVTSAGVIVISHLDYRSDAIRDSSYVSILISEDCGRTWDGPYTVEDTIGPYFEDKPFITSDRTGGPHDGNVYASWTRSVPYERRIFFSRSQNGIQWESPVIVGPMTPSLCFDSTGVNGFSQPLVGRDGTVYVFWLGSTVYAPPPQCYGAITLDFNKSTDGGLTWEGVRTLRASVVYGEVDGGVNVNSEPVAAADLSAGPHSGNINLQYVDYELTEPYNTEIWFQRSLDTGHTWSPRIRVNDDPTGLDFDQFHNWMVCNEEGILASIWYDQRTDPNHFKFDVFAAYSYDGGATWTSNHRISSVSIDPGLLAANAEAVSSPPMSAGVASTLSPNAPLAGKIAEYIGLAVSHDKVVAVWTDTRDGDQDVWSANWHLPLTDPRLLTSSGVTLSCGDTLRWATAWKENEDRYLLQASISPDFAEDDLVLSGFAFTNAFEIPPGLPDDTLYWRIKAYRAPYGVSIDSTAFSNVPWFRYTNCPCVCDCHRDPTCDGAADIVDVVDIVDAAFNNTAPDNDPSGSCPYIRTDVDCSGVTSVIDVVLMVNVVYRHAVFDTGLCGSCD